MTTRPLACGSVLTPDPPARLESLSGRGQAVRFAYKPAVAREDENSAERSEGIPGARGLPEGRPLALSGQLRATTTVAASGHLAVSAPPRRSKSEGSIPNAGVEPRLNRGGSAVRLRLSEQPPNADPTCPMSRSGLMRPAKPRLSCAAPLASWSHSRGASIASCS